MTTNEQYKANIGLPEVRPDSKANLLKLCGI
jgi:hypothetical protein